MQAVWEQLVQATANEKKAINSVSSDIAEKNAIIVRYVILGSLIVIAGSYFIAAIYKAPEDGINVLAHAYIVLAIINIIAFLVLQYKKNVSYIVMSYVANFIISCYAFIVSALDQFQVVSVAFVIVQFIMHTLYLDYSWRVNAFALLYAALYLSMIFMFKESSSYIVEVNNIVTIAALSGAIGYHMRTTRIESLLAKKELQSQVYIDPLTGIYNRRKFFEELAPEQGNITAFSIIDIDLFKNYNDSYGHQKGDECLKIMGECYSRVQNCFINNVCFYRYGGEEFTVIFFDCDFEKIEMIINTLIFEVSELNIEHKDSVLKKVTISVGVALIEDNKKGYESLLKKADVALYKAKEEGRNRVVYYDSTYEVNEEQLKNKIRER